MCVPQHGYVFEKERKRAKRQTSETVFVEGIKPSGHIKEYYVKCPMSKIGVR